ncbi:hypothetical protein [Pseudozobellia thermophila]|uniref:Uncharacterized protein n=1 Tax=Pseudozobellia thermophila TaxID=192903 RepID=A0A1M6HVD8_9FLAO|nr:hypothetical protein [Pseudozobellia thermophila]SHJ26180.1 hypothetical protein SAMN04488513_103200 [Pseudozobellia thermophila]
MRKISFVFVAAMLLSFGNVLANDLNPKNLSGQIAEMLRNNSLSSDVVNLRAQVRFTLNNEQEIVVLSVDTEDEDLENFVKAKLNYKKVELDDYEEGKLYTIGVRVAR